MHRLSTTNRYPYAIYFISEEVESHFSHRPVPHFSQSFFFFNDTATTEIYTLSLHDALPISGADREHAQTSAEVWRGIQSRRRERGRFDAPPAQSHCWKRCLRNENAHCRSGRHGARSEEHTSELQSRRDLVCRLLLEKKKNKE